MEFYVSWYPGDPDYPKYDDDCAMLVSVPSVARDWTVERLETLPRRLIIDSGGYRYAIAPKEALTPAALIKRQQKMLSDASQIEAIICARDYPILAGDLTSNQKDCCITQTIAFAHEFKALTSQRLPGHCRTLAIIQGYDADSLIYCANELKRIGFDLYGIGSLAVLRRHKPIMERIEAVASVIDVGRLHIFGMSVISVVHALQAMGAHSIDSSRPAKAAAYNEVLYSNPYRRYGILEPPEVPLAGRMPKSRRLAEPLPCECPACQDDEVDILGVGKRESIRARALHNYCHLKRIFSQQNQKDLLGQKDHVK